MGRCPGLHSHPTFDTLTIGTPLVLTRQAAQIVVATVGAGRAELGFRIFDRCTGVVVIVEIHVVVIVEERVGARRGWRTTQQKRGRAKKVRNRCVILHDDTGRAYQPCHHRDISRHPGASFYQRHSIQHTARLLHSSPHNRNWVAQAEASNSSCFMGEVGIARCYLFTRAAGKLIRSTSTVALPKLLVCSVFRTVALRKLTVALLIWDAMRSNARERAESRSETNRSDRPSTNWGAKRKDSVQKGVHGSSAGRLSGGFNVHVVY